MANGRLTVFIAFHQFSQYFGLTASDVWLSKFVRSNGTPVCVTFDEDALRSPLAGKLAAHLASIGMGVIVWADETHWQKFMDDVKRAHVYANAVANSNYSQALPNTFAVSDVVAPNTADEHVLVRRVEFD